MPKLKLTDPIDVLPGVGSKRAQDLAQAGINTVRDLLFYLPFRYLDAQTITPLNQLEEKETMTVQAEVLKHQPLKTRGGRRFIITTIADNSARITITFFNQQYVLQSLKVGQTYTFTGQVNRYRGNLTFTNPSYELANQESIHTGRIVPIYSQTSNLSMRLIRRLLYSALNQFNLRLPEYLPPAAQQAGKLLPRETASFQVHFPDNLGLAYQARQRLAFDELWELFTALQKQEQQLKKEKTCWSWSNPDVGWFTKIAPFSLTTTQQQACLDISQQLQQTHPTKHVVQGEVGSGKTLVAAFALLATAKNNQQALYLAPTTILAQQHYQVLRPLAEQLGLECHLWTASEKMSIGQGEILVGTHALLHQTDNFQPALIVVDEEHRFGVKQRQKYWQSKPRPHLISMTATPIPRTLASVLFTNQSVSFLDLIPGQEKNITTRIFPSSKLASHLEWLGQQIQTGQQAFLIAPLIQPSEAEGFEHLMDAHTLYELAQQHLPHPKIALLTGKHTDQQKKETLEAMRGGQISVLVATPVIEVGIDIPKAAIITITSAERFGLAQLHQLRGRVGRQGQASWCFLMPSKKSSDLTRLKQLENTQEGWKLAEADLKQRGVGEFLGTRQSGWDTLEIASWLDLNLLKKAKTLHEKYRSSL